MARRRKKKPDGLVQQVTASGRAVSPYARGLGSTHLFDVARQLANCPYGLGHTPRFVSLAQFSILTARAMPAEDAAHALLFHAPAGYVGSVPSTVGRAIFEAPTGDLVEADLLHQLVLDELYRAFGLAETTHPLLVRLAEASWRAAATVSRDVGPAARPGAVRPVDDPLPEPMTPLSPDEAYSAWLAAFAAARPRAPRKKEPK